jgi:hypothetical protein
MDPIAVDIRLIRALLAPDLRIAPGRVLMARVASVGSSGRGMLSIAGTLIEAELPPEVHAGQELRLTVQHASAEKVVLRISQDQPPPASPQPAAIALPGGGTVRLTEREAASSDSSRPGTHVLALRYDAPAVGPVDLRFELDPGSLRVTATLAAGAPVQQAEADAQNLRQALSDGVERAITVAVKARQEPLDVYA